MAKPLESIENKPMEIQEIKEWVEEMMNFMFNETQENLSISVPWGDDQKSDRNRKPTIISDRGALLLSGNPPEWHEDTLSFSYDSPYAEDVEFGSDAKKVPIPVLARWAKRKLGMKEGEAFRFAKRVAKKIAEEGIPPHPYIRPGINETIRKFDLKVTPIPL